MIRKGANRRPRHAIARVRQVLGAGAARAIVGQGSSESKVFIAAVMADG